jgi:hypothetical protein
MRNNLIIKEKLDQLRSRFEQEAKWAIIIIKLISNQLTVKS